MKAVTLYRPGVLENALSEFDRYMGSFFGDNILTPSEKIFNRIPSIDVQENEKAYVLEAELPGFEEKDIEVRVDNNCLTIESRKEEQKDEAPVKADDGKKYLIRERKASSFSRSFRLPDNADLEGITASFRNGLLSLTISKKPEAQKRVIEIAKN